MATASPALPSRGGGRRPPRSGPGADVVAGGSAAVRGDRGRGPLVGRARLSRRQPRAPRPARRAGASRRPDRRRGPDPDDRVPALRGAALPARRRPGGCVGAAPAPGAAPGRRHAAPRATTADTDRFQLDGLIVYRTLVLRRSPAQSRPPSPYRLVWRGHYYEVWQRGPGRVDPGVVHLGLGTEFDPAGDAPLRARAASGRPRPAVGGSLAAVRPGAGHRGPADLRRATRPPGRSLASGPSLSPVTPGTLEATVRVPEPGAFEIWLGGSVRPQVDLVVDGRPAG